MAPPTAVKICGLTDLAHLRVAEAAGATYVGLIVEIARSPRGLTRVQARVLARAARVPAVAVTDDPDPGRVAELARFVQPAVMQWYGWAPETVIDLRRSMPSSELWVCVGVEEGKSSEAEQRLASAIDAGADRVVLDTARAGRSGGTGEAMDWELAARLVRSAYPTPVVLAGGLTPANVAEAVRRVEPAAVDVSSGVETAPGLKSARLIRAFMEAVREVTSG